MPDGIIDNTIFLKAQTTGNSAGTQWRKTNRLSFPVPRKLSSPQSTCVTSGGILTRFVQDRIFRKRIFCRENTYVARVTSNTFNPK